MFHYEAQTIRLSQGPTIIIFYYYIVIIPASLANSVCKVRHQSSVNITIVLYIVFTISIPLSENAIPIKHHYQYENMINVLRDAEGRECKQFG